MTHCGEPAISHDSHHVSLVSWTDDAEDRFYVSEVYRDKQFRELSESEAKQLGIPLFSERSSVQEPTQTVRPLRMMALFSGAGGLSTGLEAAGSTVACWAVENFSDAAAAFSLNHPLAKVYTEDCSNLLERIMAGTDGPAKGEVEMIVGGPPCQGYSLLNHHRNSQASLLKNSCVASFLSYCDFYRPRYVLMENVATLVSHDTGLVIKLVISSLVRMGYQVAFGLLSAGHFGIPQGRKRLIITAAAPGERLPAYPQPQYAAGNVARVKIGIQSYHPCSEPVRLGAPRRAITVWDAISDLPEIVSGHMEETMGYDLPPLSHMQVDAEEGSIFLLIFIL
jgi:DNA (cytosine-5)-methyltransferase 1